MLTDELSNARPARPLLDRDGDLIELDRALAEAVAGEGRVLLIEGPPGIGKTSLLEELRGRGRARGMTVLAARGGELEQGFGFGIVHQLLDTALAGAGSGRAELLAGSARLAEPVFLSDTRSDGPDGDIAYATLHGLYWLVANLAELGPLALTVDDVQWADDPSLRFLLHLAHRMTGMPVLLALTARSGHMDRPNLESLLLEAQPPLLRPAPISESSVHTLVRDGLGEDTDPALSAACRKATGGNPFLLAELLGELRRDGRPVGEINPAQVQQIAPERIAVAVRRRVSRLDSQAPMLAQAVAVLGPQARLASCAALAGVDPGRALSLADSLVALAVLEPGEPLRFLHPIVRTAIYEGLPAVRRAELHGRAAWLLTELGADAATVAVHLLATPPAGNQAVAATLRDAADRALAVGAPDTAVDLLTRALTEPPDAETRPLILSELGRAEHESFQADAAKHLREAGETARDPVIRARTLVILAWNTVPFPDLQQQQMPLYERAAADVWDIDRELALELEAARLGSLLWVPDLRSRFESEVERFRDLRGETAAECLLLSFVARKSLCGIAGWAAGADLAERAAAHPVLTSTGGNPMWRTNTTLCLLAAERYDVAERLLSDAVRNAERQGSPQWLARASYLRGLVRHRRGDLSGAEADGRGAYGATARTPQAFTAPTVVLDALIDQGRVAEAEALLTECKLDDDLQDVPPSIWTLTARGRLRAAAGNLHRARADLEETLRRVGRYRGGFIPFGFDARIALVQVLDDAGEHAQASALAEETLSLALASDSRRVIGGALRAAGVIRAGTEGLALLARAVVTLAESPSLLWRAAALVDYGAALRRDGQRAAARDVLREGLDIAQRCSAHPLADRAAEQLKASGARPRRIAVSGADSLTASERRVAELAIEGMSNKQIAQALFVTLRTVEMHLTNAYGKLGLTSRQDLAEAVMGSRAG